jgi:hypothetical protein
LRPLARVERGREEFAHREQLQEPTAGAQLVAGILEREVLRAAVLAARSRLQGGDLLAAAGTAMSGGAGVWFAGVAGILPA